MMFTNSHSFLRIALGFHNPNHAAALACAVLPLCWGWGRKAWLGRVLSGGSLIWYPTKGGHELNDCARQLARAFLAAAASKNVCTLWGEDDTRRILPCAQIDVEFRNPLYTNEIAGLWRR